MTGDTSQLKGRLGIWRKIANDQSIRLKTTEARAIATQKKLNEGDAWWTQRESELNVGLESLRREVVESKGELEILKNEKAGNFGEHKILYDAEIASMGERFEAEVEKAANIRARADMAAEVQEYEGKISVLIGDNNDLVSLLITRVI